VEPHRRIVRCCVVKLALAQGAQHTNTPKSLDVADIAPMGGGPGLQAFIWPDCGRTNSVLVYPMEVGHGQV
jgi:hypothetical protein